jgi:cell wall-associated NlpC family hydrolase
MIDIDINDLIGKPFKGGGRGPDEYDCWGLSMEIYKRLGITLPNFPVEGAVCEAFNKEVSGIIEEEVEKNRWEELKKLEEGCFIIFKSHPYFVQHIGIYLGSDKYIHTGQKTGAEVRRITDPRVKNNIRGYYKYVTTS